MAAAMAFRNGCQKAQPVLLEPIMQLEIIVPDEFLGEVIGDLNSRKGKIEKITSRKKIQQVRAMAPLSLMFGYSTALRSASQGRATFTMHFSHYNPVSSASAGGPGKLLNLYPKLKILFEKLFNTNKGPEWKQQNRKTSLRLKRRN